MEFVDNHHQPRRRGMQHADVLRMAFRNKAFSVFQFKLQRMQCADRMLQVEVAYAAHAVR